MEDAPRYEHANPTNRYRVDTLFQGGEILKVIANSREPLGSEEIARRMDLTPNKAFRLCATLEELGFLEEIGNKFELGMGLALLRARKRASLMAQRDQLEQKITSLEENNE
jgi:DNA-binding IclR family transcriptional regulator